MNVRKLAELVGVSTATISRVLRGDPVVEPETRDRVLFVLSQHPFYPDFKKKKKKLKNLFVFLSPAHINERLHMSQINFFSRALAGVRSVFDTANFNDGLERYLLLSSFQSGQIIDKFKQLERLDYAGSIAGAFIIHTKRQDESDLAGYDGGIKPYVLGRSHLEVSSPFADCFYFDEKKAGFLAYEHLRALGHRRILVFSGPPDYSYFGLREAVFKENDGRDGNRFRFVNARAVSPDAAFELAETVIGSAGLHESAVFVTAEILLEGLLRYLDEARIRIPDDLSIISTNDYLIGYQHHPPVSAIRTPHFEIGRLAATVALENCRFEYRTRVDYCLDVMLNDRHSVARLSAKKRGGRREAE